MQIIEQSLQQRAVESARIIIQSLFREYRDIHQGTASTPVAPASDGSQDQADAGSSEFQFGWLDCIDASMASLNPADLIFELSSTPNENPSVFNNVQLGDIPEALAHTEDSPQKLSDSGYDSNNQEPNIEKEPVED
jgi:hypothetical protein